MEKTLKYVCIYTCPFFFAFARSFVQLAAAVAMNGDLPRAEILHREALSIMERTLAPDDPRVAEVLFNLSAVVGGQRGRLGETENILHRCLEAQRRLHGVGGALVLRSFCFFWSGGNGGGRCCCCLVFFPRRPSSLSSFSLTHLSWLL